MAKQTEQLSERYARFERALVHDRERKRAARAALDAAGEPHGHRIDQLVVDAIALMLRGRQEGDVVRDAYMSALGDVLRVHEIPVSKGLRGRLRARLSVNSNLRAALAQRDLVDLVRDLDA